MELMEYLFVGIALLLWVLISILLYMALAPWCRIHPFIWIVLGVIFPPFLIVIGLYITGATVVAICLMAFPDKNIQDVEYRVIDR